MKRLFTVLAAAAALAACTKTYEFNADFTVPTSLNGPDAVALDITSSETVVLSWEGGSAADGGIVLYTVLFDKEGGNFSEPVAVKPSDLGAGSTLTLSHAELNAIARSAGIKTESTGKLIWTVTASRGGEIRPVDLSRTLSVTRGEGIDNFPKTLFLKGAGSVGVGEKEGRAFRIVEDGVYQIYTKLANGPIYFESEPETASTYYHRDGKLLEGNGNSSVETSGVGQVARITVNFNTLKVTQETISGVRVAFNTGKFFADMVLDNDVLSYIGEGVFFSSVGCDHFFHGWDWCAAPNAGEERYTIYVDVDGREMEWGTTDSKYGASRPGLNYGIEYFELKEFEGRPDWGGNTRSFKFPSECENACFDITLYTNKDNRMYHQFTNFSEYVAGGRTSGELTVPSSVTIIGTGSDMDGVRLTKVGEGVFQLPVVAFNGAPFYLDGGSCTYYVSGSRIIQGDNAAGVSATPEGQAERLTLDFNTGAATREAISEISIVKAARTTTYPNGELSYVGNGEFLAKGVQCEFTDMGGWWDERYSFYVTIGDNKYTWGRPDDGDAESRATVDADGKFSRPLAEFAGQGQWDHLWKLATICDKATFTVKVTWNASGFSHEVSNIQSLEENPIPATLTITGAGAEQDGQSLVKLDEGVFELFCTSFNGGAVAFNGNGRSYYLDGNKIKQGAAAAVSATPAGEAERVVLDFNSLEVKRMPIKNLRLCLSADNIHTITNGTLEYVPSEHKWRATGCNAEFFRGWDWCAANGEERYVFCVNIDGKECQWGASPAAEQRPSDRTVIQQLHEFGDGQTDQWSHCYKMHADCETSTFTAEVWFNGTDIWHQFKDFAGK
ncbi:MAG: SusE domain-containing protein [Bacteroidales bacterium]|nr:SusE domain-containing protein [Bacteroidales bacterium]